MWSRSSITSGIPYRHWWLGSRSFLDNNLPAKVQTGTASDNFLLLSRFFRHLNDDHRRHTISTL